MHTEYADDGAAASGFPAPHPSGIGMLPRIRKDTSSCPSTKLKIFNWKGTVSANRPRVNDMPNILASIIK